MTLRSAVSALALLAALAGCEREMILPGERFDTRAPLDASVPTEAQPQPVDATGEVVNRSVPIALPAVQANAEWTHRAGSLRHIMPHGALSAAPTRVWSLGIGQGNSRKNRISAAPVVANGAVYTIDATTRVQATSLSGAPLWTADLTPPFDSASEVSGGGLAVAGGRLYATTGSGELVALNAATGDVVWRQRTDTALTGAPAVEGNTVYAVGRDASAWALDATDGKVRWTLTGTPGQTGMIGAASPAVTDRAVLFPFVSGEVVAALKQGGVKIWSAGIVGSRLGRGYGGITDVTGDPVVDGAVTYVGNAAGRTYAISSSSGDTIWSVAEGALGPVLPVGGSVFLVNDEARLVRLDAATGEVIWSVEMPYFEAEKPKKHKTITAHYGPVLAGGRIAVASGDGLLRLFNPTDGTLVASAEIPGGAASQPALAGGLLLVVGGDGQIHAFR